MAINLATKYSGQVDEVIRKGALTGAGTNNNVDFIGAKSVKVYSMETAPLNDYNANGANRYGTPAEIEDTVQEMTMTQAKSFTFTIDKTNAVDSPEGVRDAGQALRRQIDNVIIPEVDRYRLSVFANKAGNKYYTENTAANAYATFLAANTAITDEEFPVEGRVAFCKTSFVELLKKSPEYTRNTELAQDRIIFRGMVGECDGVSIIAVPSKRMPAGVSFIITHPICAPAPVKIQDYKIHDDPPGIAGRLVEGLIYHDCFVFDNKKAGMAVNFGAFGTLAITMTADETGKGKVAVTGNTSGASLVYKTASSVTAPTLGTDLSNGWTALPADGVVSATSGHKICVAAINADKKAVGASDVITVTVG
ncbi:MAG: N4-gp56 family major capsid protein [Ruminiclostridium sp.]|nr:N4-gp56 family major capsid protein [Ruminiclostridium sp.]